MTFPSRKRNLSANFSENITKKFKDFNYSDEECNDNQLRIDLDIQPAEAEKIEYEENIKSITWTRPNKADYINITGSNGFRCFVKVQDNKNEIRSSNISPTASENYYTLLDQAEEALKNKNEIFFTDTKLFYETSNSLLVSKYMPRRYTDLISTESSNRLLLGWLKSWDKYVFNKDTKFIEKLKSNVPNNTSHSRYEELLQMSANGRMPAKTVVLLSGAPGLGKTTLATIIAKHCGYDAIEINASDDCSSEIFKNKISELNNSVYSNQSVTSPTCLIMDEVDGATEAAISVLVKAIIATSDSKSQKDMSVPLAHKKKQLTIKRPIICICNDLYASSLKQLRPLSFVIKIASPDYNQLMHRLDDICKLENIDCDRGILTNIIDISNRDIRSCLNTLQFLKQQGSIANNQSCTGNILPMNIGQKDMEINTFKIWQDIFTETGLKNSYIASTGKPGRDLSVRCQHILKISHSSGDIDRIINGIYENYLNVVTFKDLFLQGMVDGADWLVFNDLANRLISRSQLYDMYRYKQYLIPFFHLSFASTKISSERIQWPMSLANHRQKKQKIESIYNAFISNQCSVSNWIQCQRDVIECVLPHLIQIIRPIQLRPINTQLYTSREKEMFQNTVNVMVSTGLGYIQQRLADMQYQYILNPNIEEIVRFNLTEVAQKELTYSTKQLISNEVNRERIRMSESHRHKSSKPDTNNAKVLQEHSQNRIGYIMQKANDMKIKSTIISSNAYRDSFNFRIGPKISSKNSTESNSISSILNQPVWFRYKEGFSNSIKRSVKIRDL